MICLQFFTPLTKQFELKKKQVKIYCIFIIKVSEFICRNWERKPSYLWDKSLCNLIQFNLIYFKCFKGNNILFVSVGGPSGQCDEVCQLWINFNDQLLINFQLKVYIRHMGQNIYNVYYRVRDVGEYRIVVKYGSDHIPGSPFHLRI